MKCSSLSRSSIRGLDSDVLRKNALLSAYLFVETGQRSQLSRWKRGKTGTIKANEHRGRRPLNRAKFLKLFELFSRVWLGAGGFFNVLRIRINCDTVFQWTFYGNFITRAVAQLARCLAVARGIVGLIPTKAKKLLAAFWFWKRIFCFCGSQLCENFIFCIHKTLK